MNISSLVTQLVAPERQVVRLYNTKGVCPRCLIRDKAKTANRRWAAYCAPCTKEKNLIAYNIRQATRPMTKATRFYLEDWLANETNPEIRAELEKRLPK